MKRKLVRLAIVLLLPLTMATSCPRGEVVRKQVQPPSVNKNGNKVPTRYCVHLKDDKGEIQIDCELSKAEYDRTSIGDKR